jgi:hypothetical protein
VALVSTMALACSVYDAELTAGNVSPGETDDAGPDAGAGGSGGGETTSGRGTSMATVGTTGPTSGAGGASNAATGAGGGRSTGSTGATGGAGGASTTTSGGGGASTTGTAGHGGSGGAGGAKVDAGGAGGSAGCPSPTLCAAQAALVHRYSFQGAGTSVVDSVGGANGTVVNGRLTGNGDVRFGDGIDQYVDLPSGIIRPLTNATIEAWVRWDGGPPWQRLFDFGSSDAGAGARGFAVTTLYLTPLPANGPTTMLVGLKRAGQNSQFETRVLTGSAMASGVTTHIAVVIDGTNGTMTVYRNGAFDGSVASPTQLSALNDVNNWLGRSQYLSDPAFQGSFDEFRIYRAALTKDQVQASFAVGPNPIYFK